MRKAFLILLVLAGGLGTWALLSRTADETGEAATASRAEATAPSWPPTAPFFLPRERSISMNIEFDAENFLVPVFVPFTRVVPADSRMVVLLGT
jgi:hypothetical protein